MMAIFKALVIAAALLVVIVLLLIFITSGRQISTKIATYNSSVSALLLSNWVNDSALIYTGIPNPEIGLEGIPYISDIMLEGYGLLNYRFYMLGGNSTKAVLSLNNQILINRTNATDLISLPLDSNSMVIEQNSSGINEFLFEMNGNNSHLIKNDTLILGSNPTVYLYSPNSSFKVLINNSKTYAYILGSGNSSVIVSFSAPPSSLPALLSENDAKIHRWLDDSVNISLGGSFLNEYHTSLLLIKDDQNPITGEFAASPSPIYLYAWVRDGSFAAMALQDAGHVNSAEKYWSWMASVQNGNGTWYTRYNFWNSVPDTSYGIPEYDSLGLFQIGITSLFNLTHDSALVSGFIPTINKSLRWEELNINKSKFQLIPEDLSIWEDVLAYNFWTQAIDLLGMKQSSYLFSSFGLPTTVINRYSNSLNNSIQKYFYNGTYYAEYATTAEIYINGSGSLTLLPSMIADSSSILPIALGLVSVNSVQAKSDINSMIKALTKEGGLARFTGDNYHYTLALRDSSGPMPPWIITTLFLAYYYEKIGNHTGALNMMTWAISHSQNGLLPEAIDPNHGNPLQTTSPLTWSSAMYVITALNYKS